MSQVDTYVMGDLHFGHEAIPQFRPFPTREAHEERIMDEWLVAVRPKDKIYLMGDVSFTLEGLLKVRSLPGKKYLVRGNHDTLPFAAYAAVFEDVFGLLDYKRPHRERAWLSHAPIHPVELFGRINIHGHAHNGHVMAGDHPDPRYINVCPEFIGYRPILLHPLLPRKEAT